MIHGLLASQLGKPSRGIAELLHQKRLNELIKRQLQKNRDLSGEQEKRLEKQRIRALKAKKKELSIQSQQKSALKELKKKTPALKKNQTIEVADGVMAQVQTSVEAQKPKSDDLKKMQSKKLVPMSLKKTLANTRELKQKSVVQLKAAYGHMSSIIKSGGRKTFTQKLGAVKNLTPKTMRTALNKGMGKMRTALTKIAKASMKDPKVRHIDDRMGQDEMGMG